MATLVGVTQIILVTHINYVHSGSYRIIQLYARSSKCTQINNDIQAIQII